MGRVTVVGLGPGGPDLITAATSSAIAASGARFLRTARHPAAAAVPGATAFDHVYDTAPSLDEVYATIVETLVAAAAEGDVLYAVPGSPAVAERSVELLGADQRVHVDVLPALSCLDLAWVRLGVDPLAGGVRIVDGRNFASEAAGERGPLLVLQCDDPHLLSEIKLSVDEDESATTRVTVLQRLGLPDEAVVEMAWNDLDRVTPDHLTSLWIPSLAAPVGAELVRFVELVRTLRQRCPWDRQQTHQTLTRHLLEETHEVVEAIDGLGRGPDAGFGHLEEELGDLLFQVVFHATLAAEEGQFTLADVARTVHDKLVRRHPHVFGDAQADSAEAVLSGWEQIKQVEKGRTSLMEGLPRTLPALLSAHQVQRKAASVGLDWDDVTGAFAKVAEELAELEGAARSENTSSVADELGDLLFSCVNVARHLGVDPEAALRRATAKFRGRFVALEGLAAERGLDLPAADLARLDALWETVKVSEMVRRETDAQ
jgi:tetrapyrrole methylase family protein/MazG family protein